MGKLISNWAVSATAVNTKRAAREARKQTQLMRQANLRASLPPAGWVSHPNDPAWLIWWDGQQYTTHVKPLGA